MYLTRLTRQKQILLKQIGDLLYRVSNPTLHTDPRLPFVREPVFPAINLLPLIRINPSKSTYSNLSS